MHIVAPIKPCKSLKEIYLIESYTTFMPSQPLLDQGVESSILAFSKHFVEIDHEVISTAILLPPLISKKVVVSNKPKYVHEVLVNHLVKLAQEKCVVR